MSANTFLSSLCKTASAISPDMGQPIESVGKCSCWTGRSSTGNGPAVRFCDIYLDFANPFTPKAISFFWLRTLGLGGGHRAVDWSIPHWTCLSKELGGPISMRSGAPQVSVIAPLRFPLFVNNLLNALEELTLLYAVEVKILIHRTLETIRYRYFNIAWDG